jgi:hypothetical protein
VHRHVRVDIQKKVIFERRRTQAKELTWPLDRFCFLDDERTNLHHFLPLSPDTPAYPLCACFCLFFFDLTLFSNLPLFDCTYSIFLFSLSSNQSTHSYIAWYISWHHLIVSTMLVLGQLGVWGFFSFSWKNSYLTFRHNESIWKRSSARTFIKGQGTGRLVGIGGGLVRARGYYQLKILTKFSGLFALPATLAWFAPIFVDRT